ncbi:glutathione S-transferase 1-like [Pecten maximus]|uniref:glutathione S-transferase 1-like n=1 Tax=Pecten maximus TaxID=6579 RepID=UPI001458E17C|nr:glutathione S-transferase 1-like [Pecten maximus]
MSKYKLIFFPYRGRGELVRLTFMAAGVEYDEEIIEKKEWPKFKSKMPTEQLPVLEVDGRRLAQSLAITRYLAREFGLAGQGNLGQCLVDMVVDTAADAFKEYLKYHNETDEDKKAELQKKVVAEITPQFARIFQNLLENNDGTNDCFVGSSLTLADLAFYEVFTHFLGHNSEALKDFPKLAANRKMVEENKNLKQYLTNRYDSIINPRRLQQPQRHAHISLSSMSTYKLIYFDARARAELIRLVFAAAGQTYTDEIVNDTEWPALKPKMPTGQLPVLEVDGKQLSQSLAIARYLAREFDMAGQGNLEQCLVDQVVETAADGFNEFYEYYKLNEQEKDTDKKEELKKAFVSDAVPKFARIFTTFIENSGGKNGYFVGAKLTIADMACHDIFTTFLLLNPDALNDFPKLAANRQKVEENEKIKEYIAKRPENSI